MKYNGATRNQEEALFPKDWNRRSRSLGRRIHETKNKL